MTITNNGPIPQWVALQNEILRGVVGSTVHGTAIEGQDDRDEMGVAIEPADFVCGLRTFEHYVQRDRPQGVRSQQEVLGPCA